MDAPTTNGLTGRCPQFCTYEGASHRCVRCGLPPRDPRTHGGPRTAGPGKRMGRPPKETPLQRVNLRLEREAVDQLRAIGEGNITRGVRRLLEERAARG